MLGRLMNLRSAAKLLVFSLTVLSSSFLFKLALAHDSTFSLFLSSLPRRPWTSLRLCLSPVHLYFILNFIIIAIVATSAIQPRHKHAPIVSDQSKLTDSEEEIGVQQTETKQPASHGSAESGDEAEGEDTMDATWQAIMEAQGKLRSGIWKLPAAESMSEEELKRKAEAFIERMNEEMRLEREESELKMMLQATASARQVY